jgi:hypothetical protein
MGYELKTFEEKKALGMTDGYDPEPVMPTEVMPRDAGPSIADMFEQQARELAQSDARLYRRAGEGLQRMREGLDQLDQLEDPALAPAPVRPEPLQLADTPAPAPKIDIPAGASTKLSVRGTDDAARSLFDWGNAGSSEGLGPIKTIEQARDLVMAKGRLLWAERIPGIDFDRALNDRAMGRMTPDVEAVRAAYRQFYGAPEPAPQGPKPRSKKADQATRQQIQANEQRMAELRRKMQDEGCSL